MLQTNLPYSCLEKVKIIITTVKDLLKQCTSHGMYTVFSRLMNFIYYSPNQSIEEPVESFICQFLKRKRKIVYQDFHFKFDVGLFCLKPLFKGQGLTVASFISLLN